MQRCALLSQRNAGLAKPWEQDWSLLTTAPAGAIARPPWEQARQGRPVVDPLTGRQQINRNLEEEQRFFRWMRENNITDTNRGLALYVGQRPSGGSKSATKPILTKGQVVNGYEYLGGDPKDQTNWIRGGGGLAR